MGTDNSVKAQMEALEIRIENRLQEVLNDFKKDLLGSLSKFQQGGSSSSTLHRSGNTRKGPQDCDTIYSYMKVDGQLAKICQTSTVLEYQSRFEKLSNQARDWSERQLLDTFIEGLIPEIRCEVKACQPRTMIAVISFAHLHEKKINRENHGNKSDNNQMISKLPALSIPNQSLDT